MATPQEDFWAQEFGAEYADRNRGSALVAANVDLFAQVIRRTGPIGSMLELGANIGLNVQALLSLLPEASISAVEINPRAVEELKTLQCTVHHSSIIGWKSPDTFDLVFTKGVLIHINPDLLSEVYDTMAESSRRFVLVAEYYNPPPVSVAYRGHEDRLFKRDFAGEFLDRHADFDLIDYGFRYHRGPFAQDDFTWFLMERRR
jgi:pseudaminic acid biosynthesis-associated methylase